MAESGKWKIATEDTPRERLTSEELQVPAGQFPTEGGVDAGLNGRISCWGKRMSSGGAGTTRA